ncbi:GTPase, G3E family [Shimia gijangensis]|uniref:GTPase, G3E family n=1 Tax=Shimia gijangensis TaxID=1470563 RepID=A0A1M6GLJ4_9RHOB|nr:GTP-binding protein [Shimia gijangensis]SHJ10783.1 GTPase, G3E family [Shimia gijangensis]
MTKTPVPVTIISGYLGSGKTTLVNRLLKGDHGKKITVMVNDFGDVNIDADLIVQRNQQVMELSNGCVCCSLQGDLVVQLQALFQGDTEMDHVLIEASGVSQPGRIASVFGYPQFRETARLDAVVTLVDAANVNTLPPASSGLVRSQIEAADIVLLTKADLMAPSDIDALREDWLFPDLPALNVVNGDIPADVLLGFHRDADPKSPVTAGDHSDIFTATSWSSTKPISLEAFRATMKTISHQVFRAKGFLNCVEHPHSRVLYQKVGSRETFDLDGSWQGVAETRIVAIGEHLDQNDTDLLGTLDHCHA